MKFIYHNIGTHHYHNSNTPLKEERKWLLSTASFPLLPLSLSKVVNYSRPNFSPVSLSWPRHTWPLQLPAPCSYRRAEPELRLGPSWLTVDGPPALPSLPSEAGLLCWCRRRRPWLWSRSRDRLRHHRLSGRSLVCSPPSSGKAVTAPPSLH